MIYVRRLTLAVLGLMLTLAMGAIGAPGDAKAQGWEPKSLLSSLSWRVRAVAPIGSRASFRE